METQTLGDTDKDAVASLHHHDSVNEYQAGFELCCLSLVWLEDLGDQGLLGEHEDTYKDCQTHSVDIAHLCISDSLLMLSLSDVVADHGGNCVGETHGEHEGKSKDT